MVHIDANEEISILKDQLTSQTTSSISATTNSALSNAPSSLFPNISDPSDDDLLRTPPPPNLNLSDLSPDSESLTALSLTPRAPAPPSFLGTPKGQSSLLQRAGFQPNKSSFFHTTRHFQDCSFDYALLVIQRITSNTYIPTFCSS